MNLVMLTTRVFLQVSVRLGSKEKKERRKAKELCPSILADHHESSSHLLASFFSLWVKGSVTSPVSARGAARHVNESRARKRGHSVT